MMSLFAIQQKEHNSWQEFLLHSNTAALEISSVTSEVLASAFAQDFRMGTLSNPGVVAC